MTTAQEIEQQKIAQETELAQQRADAAAHRAIYQARKKLEQAQEEEKLFEEQQRIQRARLALELELQRQRLEDQLATARLKAEHEQEELQGQLTLEATMTPTNLQMAILRAVSSLYESIPLKQVNLVNMGSNQGVESLLTNLVVALRTTGEALGVGKTDAS